MIYLYICLKINNNISYTQIFHVLILIINNNYSTIIFLYTGIINVTDISSKFTIDTIGKCAFGINCNTLFNSNTEFQRAGQAVFTPTLKSSVLNFMRLIDLGWLVDLLRLRNMPDLVYEFYFNLFQDTLELRKNEKEDRKDFISILIQLRNEEKTNNSRVGNL